MWSRALRLRATTLHREHFVSKPEPPKGLTLNLAPLTFDADTMTVGWCEYTDDVAYSALRDRHRDTHVFRFDAETQFLRHVTAALTEREGRIEAFHRALTHEIRNRIGATLGAGQLLAEPSLAEVERAALAGVVVRNATGMRLVLENLLELAQSGGAVGHPPSRQQRHVRLPAAAAEAARQVRDAAERAGVTVRLAADLPDVEVPAAAVELCLVNYLSNAIKYADPGRDPRTVTVMGAVTTDPTGTPEEVVVRVVDNGLGVPRDARDRLFTRFFRAHVATAPTVEGTGLGLSIIRETVETLGGRVWAEFPGEGSVFVMALPCRRAVDAVAIAERVARI